MTSAFLPWLAGFWEGEGCFYVSSSGKTEISIRQAGKRGETVLTYIQRRLKIGRVRPDNPPPKKNWQLGYKYKITKTEDALTFIQLILPHLRFRKDEVSIKLPIVMEYYKNRRHRLWSRDEINFLKKNYAQMTDKMLGRKLGRSRHSVNWKRGILGLERPLGRPRKSLNFISDSP